MAMQSPVFERPPIGTSSCLNFVSGRNLPVNALNERANPPAMLGRME